MADKQPRKSGRARADRPWAWESLKKVEIKKIVKKKITTPPKTPPPPTTLFEKSLALANETVTDAVNTDGDNGDNGDDDEMSITHLLTVDETENELLSLPSIPSPSSSPGSSSKSESDDDDRDAKRPKLKN